MKILSVILLIAFAVPSFSQIKKDKKIPLPDSEIDIKTIPKHRDSLLLIKKQVPYFDNVQPVINKKLTTFSDQIIIPNAQFDKNPILIDPSILKPISSDVDGKLTPRDNYKSPYAYLEFINAGSVNPEINQASCRCEGGALTYVKVVFLGLADKRYLLTLDVSPKRNGQSSNVGMFSNGGFTYSQIISEDNTPIDVVIRPSSRGMVELWMQCTSPNDNPTSWKFNSATIQTIE